MTGAGDVRFSELFADTVIQHGIFWAWSYYVLKRGMPEWEFRFWANTSKVEWK